MGALPGSQRLLQEPGSEARVSPEWLGDTPGRGGGLGNTSMKMGGNSTY